MRSRSGVRFLAAGALGAFTVVMAVGIVTRSSDTTPSAETTTTTTTSEWISEREVRIGPSVIVPIALDDEAPGKVAFTYEVIPLVPQGGEGPIEFIPATPIELTLQTRQGTEIAATARGPGARVIVFDVPDGVTASDAESVTVDRYLTGSPVAFAVDVPLEGAAWHPAGPGVRVRLVRILEQAQNDLVVVELDAPSDATTHLTIDGIGRDWASASGSMLGSSRWTLDYRGDDLPDPLPLEVRGILFVPVDTDLTLDVTGLTP